MPTPCWHGTVDTAGRLHLDAPGGFAAFIRQWRHRAVTVTVRPRSRGKSLRQLGYLWGVLYPILAESIGYHAYELDALHDALMRRLCPKRETPNPLDLRASLAEMDQAAVSRYITEVRAFALLELGIVTPDADHAEESHG